MNIDKLCELCAKYSSTKTKLKLKINNLKSVTGYWDKNSVGFKNKQSEVEYLNGVLEVTRVKILKETNQL